MSTRKWPGDFINKIICGDCLEVMKEMLENSVDAVVCDPPYGLEFMGKEWDKLWDKREFGKTEYSKKSFTCSNGSTRKTNPVTRNLKNPNYKAGVEAQLWHTQWLTEAYRVLKPGGSMLVMGGTRTSHRLACAIEDSGFIIKDTLMWIYGSGFPKAQDLGKMIDKRAKAQRKVIGHYIAPDGIFRDCKNHKPNEEIRNPETHYGYKTSGFRPIDAPSTDLAKHWDGFKVGGIKPAYEPIIWAVKPPEGSYVDNVLKWGVGAVNVDETRINGQPHHNEAGRPSGEKSFVGKGNPSFTPTKGRFPANVILSHHPECVQVGMKKVKGTDRIGHENKISPSGFLGNQQIMHSNIKHADSNGLETVESWNCHPGCPIRMLDGQSGVLKSGGGKTTRKNMGALFDFGQGYSREEIGDSGGASRFFYCAKASRGERNAGLEETGVGHVVQMTQHGGAWICECGRKYMVSLNKCPKCNSLKRELYTVGSRPIANRHPTVKPIKLFEYLIKLVTREGQIVLDPFIGSGTTAIAVHNVGRKCIGIEKEGEYLEIAKRRIQHWKNQPKQKLLDF